MFARGCFAFVFCCCFFFSSRRRHTRFDCDWSSDVCSSDLLFLSCLRGSEQDQPRMACVLPFLSCLRGSELGKKFPNPLILKELSPPAGKHPKLRGICQAVDLQGSLQAARKRVRTRRSEERRV